MSEAITLINSPLPIVLSINSNNLSVCYLPIHWSCDSSTGQCNWQLYIPVMMKYETKEPPRNTRIVIDVTMAMLGPNNATTRSWNWTPNFASDFELGQHVMFGHKVKSWSLRGLLELSYNKGCLGPRMSETYNKFKIRMLLLWYSRKC